MNDFLTIYFPTYWKIGNICVWFDDHPEFEETEPNLRVGTDWLIPGTEWFMYD